MLAAAGLARLGRDDVDAAPLEGDVFVPAPGPGLPARAGARGRAARSMRSTTVARHLALETERDVAARLGASCHTAGRRARGARFEGVVLRGFVGLPDGSEWLVDEVRAEDDDVDLEPLAAALAERMLAAGAADLLERAA